MSVNSVQSVVAVQCGAICPACEVDPVKQGATYCEFCELMKQALEEDFLESREQERAKLGWSNLPREDVGVVPIEQLMRPVGYERVTGLRRVEQYAVCFLVGACGAAMLVGGSWGIIHFALHAWKLAAR